MSTASPPWFAALSDEQRRVVTADAPTRLILAGPGSGKTATLLAAVAYQIEVRRVDPEHLLLLTFNRAIAHELVLRLGHLIGDVARRVRILTFHGCALAIAHPTLDEALWQDDDVYDNLLVDATVQLHVGPVPPWIQCLSDVVIDEYQDADSLIADLVQALAQAGLSEDQRRRLLVAGDDDQAIYQFRGGTARYLQAFEATYGATRYVLTTNYRSTPPIIAAANHLIAQSVQRAKQSAAEQGRAYPARLCEEYAPVTLATFAGPYGERPRLAVAAAMAWTAERIRDWMRMSIPAHEIAVLARKWEHLGRLAQELRYRQIPFQHLAFGGKGGKPASLTLTLPAQRWIGELRRQRKRAIPGGARASLARMQAKWQHRDDEPTVGLLQRFASTFDQEQNLRPDAAELPTGGDILTALFEAHLDPQSAREEEGVVLSSLHGVKGQEYRRVIILLRDEWLGLDEDRCLLYVGLTRAREEVVILAEDEHDALEELGLPVTLALPLPTTPDGPHFYHMECRPHQVHLGHEATVREQERIQQLREGDPLWLFPDPHPSGFWLVTTADGIPVGGLAKDLSHDLMLHRITPGAFNFAEGEVFVHQIRLCSVGTERRWIVLPTIHVARPHALDITPEGGNDYINVFL